MEDRLKKIAKKVLSQSLNIKPEESVLIITDKKLEKIAKYFLLASKTISAHSELLDMPVLKEHSEEPDDEIKKRLLDCDVALLITSKSLSHTNARKDASQKGIRIASMPGLSIKTFNRALDVNYYELKKKLVEFSKKIDGDWLRLKTKEGTDLEMQITGREIFLDTGIYINKGDFGNLPAGEVCIAPVENTTNGKLIIDGSFPGIGKIKKPIEITINKGRLIKSSSKYIYHRISKCGEDGFNVAEIGIGFNTKARVTGNTLEDEKATGTAHIAFGDNTSFGGNIETSCHLDAVTLNPEIYINGKRLKTDDRKQRTEVRK